MRNLILFSWMGMLIACSGGPKVESTKQATGIDLSVYKSFGFFDLDTAGLINREYYERNIEELKKAVRGQMQARGYVESGNPDLKVNMGVTVVEKAQTRETDFRTDRTRYMGQRNYSWQSEEVVVGYYKEGTLDFHLVDAKEGKMVWWGTVNNVVLPNKQKNMPETIQKSVKLLFEKYPVKPKA